MEGTIFRSRHNPKSPHPAPWPIPTVYPPLNPPTHTPLLRSQSPADTPLWWTNLRGWGSGCRRGWHASDSPHPSRPFITNPHAALSSVKPQPYSLRLNLSPGPWDSQAARPLREARGPLCGCAPQLVCLPLFPQIKASSHMKCFWGFKLNYTTGTTAAATITNAAWWINIHACLQLYRIIGKVVLWQQYVCVSKLIRLHELIYLIFINNYTGSCGEL